MRLFFAAESLGLLVLCRYGEEEKFDWVAIHDLDEFWFSPLGFTVKVCHPRGALSQVPTGFTRANLRASREVSFSGCVVLFVFRECARGAH